MDGALQIGRIRRFNCFRRTPGGVTGEEARLIDQSHFLL